MYISDLSLSALAHRLRRSGVPVRINDLIFKIRSPVRSVAQGVHALYADYPLAGDDGFCDFHVHVERPKSLRRWFRPQIEFRLDEHTPFKPLPLSQAFPMLEWGMNWCVANYLHTHLLLHAAVVERDGLGVILPGPPGSGKSTLCAALVNRGWRLLSDEMGAIDSEGHLISLVRPVSLKNESISVIRRFAPEAFLGAEYVDTNKGTVGHMRPPADSVRRVAEPAAPAWVIVPKYVEGSATKSTGTSKARMFMHLATNAFNYHILGAAGFERLAALVDNCACHSFEYSDLDEAVDYFNQLQRPDRVHSPVGTKCPNQAAS